MLFGDRYHAGLPGRAFVLFPHRATSHRKSGNRSATDPIARGNPGAVVGDDCLPLQSSHNDGP